MLPYVDHVLALLPFEPAAYERLRGPPCSYVGHPLTEQIGQLRPNADEQKRRDDAPPVLLVLPGSRRSEIRHHMTTFGATLARLQAAGVAFETVLPTMPHLQEAVIAAVKVWKVQPRIVIGEQEKRAAFRIAHAALAKSGTVTLELALAGVPMVTAYRTGAMEACILRRAIKVNSVILANLVIGENVVPEFLQQDCTAAKLAPAVREILRQSVRGAAAGRSRRLQKLDAIMSTGNQPPSVRAADIVLPRCARSGAAKPEQVASSFRNGAAYFRLVHVDVIAAADAGVKLARAADLLLRVLDHLAPLADPADGAGDREQHGEHRGREAHRLQRDARIEVDVRVELAVDEILVAERDLLQLQRDLQHRIVAMAGLLQDRVTHLLHDLGARIVVLVDAMAKAHQADFRVLVLHLLDEVRNLVDGADVGEHRERSFVGAAMRRAPQAGDAGGDAGERVGAGGAGDAHRRGRGVLLVVGMQDEDLVERVSQHRIDLVVLARHREAHVEEVLGKGERVLRIDEGLADGVFEGHRRQRRHLRDHPHRSDHALLRIVDVGASRDRTRRARRRRRP